MALLPFVDAGTITHAIQLAVAPVFLLTAVAGMIGAVAGRLARIIDRARLVEDLASSRADPAYLARAMAELGELRLRGRLANGCIALLTLCGFLIGLTIIFLFMGQAWGVEEQLFAVISFLLGIGTFLAALAGFMWETVLATQLLDFHVLEMKRDVAEQIPPEKS